GHHHHLAGPYLIRFAQEASWREDHRKDPNGVQVDRVVALAMRSKPRRFLRVLAAEPGRLLAHEFSMQCVANLFHARQGAGRPFRYSVLSTDPLRGRSHGAAEMIKIPI